MTIESKPNEPPFKLGILVALTLALVHFGLALWFASITPYRQPGRILSSHGAPAIDIGNPDERQHVNYVSHLLAGNGFPVFNPKDPQLGENYQFHQPPLYYLMEAAWAKALGVSDLSDSTAGVRLRALNALMGSSTVVLVFCMGAFGFRRVGVGICGASVVALLPMNVALSASVSNDPLLFCLCTGTLTVCAIAIWSGWSVRNALSVGLLVGFALLTKTTAIALLPAVLIAVVLNKENHPKPIAWAAAILPMLLLPAGWWIRNQNLYGDPFAISAFNQAFTGSPQAQPFIQAYGMTGYLVNWVGWWTVRSFFGAFGYMDIWLNETGGPTGTAPNVLYRLLLVGSFLALLGWISSLKLQPEKAAKTMLWMNVTFALVVGLLFLKFNLQYFQAQARYVLPAIGPIACGFGAGTLYLMRNRLQLALIALVLIFGGLTVYAGNRLPEEFAKRVGSF